MVRYSEKLTGENATSVEHNNSVELANAVLTLLKMDKKKLQEKGLESTIIGLIDICNGKTQIVR